MLVISNLSISFPIKNKDKTMELYLSEATQVIGSNFETMHLIGD